MNYELAKELKDAGFPQGTGRYFLEDGGHAAGSAQEVEFMLSAYEAKDTKRYHFAYIPTLEELIEECDQDRFCLKKVKHGEWQAEGDLVWEDGPTPLEAVASLYLELEFQRTHGDDPA